MHSLQQLVDRGVVVGLLPCAVRPGGQACAGKLCSALCSQLPADRAAVDLLAELGPACALFIASDGGASGGI